MGCLLAVKTTVVMTTLPIELESVMRNKKHTFTVTYVDGVPFYSLNSSHHRSK